jgi:sugar/nucleoside kinase (ribokinase family)
VQFSWDPMSSKSCDVAVVGHFSLDSLKLPSRVKPVRILGGAVAYVSLITRKLGGSSAVISKVGSDFPESYMRKLSEEGIDISAIIKVPGEGTTSFGLTYNEDLSSRSLKLNAQGSPMTVDDLPKALRAKVVHIAPIAAEIPLKVVERLREFTDCLCIDPQGMTRRFDAKGNVSCCVQMDRKILSFVNVYKSSLDEIGILTGITDVRKALQAAHDLGPEIVIATMGAQGSMLSVEGEICQVPACKPTRVVDPTGAGDVFIGAFLTEFTRKKDPFWCACVGSAAGSLVVEDVGTRFFGEKEEIYRRATAVYEKEIKH